MKRVIKGQYNVLWARVVAVVALLFFLMAFHFRKSIDGDEWYSMWAIQQGWGELWEAGFVGEVHPPLYYLMLKGFMNVFGGGPLSADLIMSGQFPGEGPVLAARLFSTISYILMLVFSGLVLKRYLGERISLIFILLSASFPFSLRYAVEIRMYSWASLFVFICGVSGYGAYRDHRPREWILFAVSGVAAAYTHHYAMIAVGVIYLILLTVLLLEQKSHTRRCRAAKYESDTEHGASPDSVFRLRGKGYFHGKSACAVAAPSNMKVGTEHGASPDSVFRLRGKGYFHGKEDSVHPEQFPAKGNRLGYWGACAAASLLCYLPWLRNFIRQLTTVVENEYWIAPIDFHQILGWCKGIFSPEGVWIYGILVMAVYGMALLCLLPLRRERTGRIALCALLVPAGVLAIGVSVSFLIRPVFIIRYLFPALPLFLLALAIGVDELQKRSRAAAIVLAVVIAGEFLVNYMMLLRGDFRM